MEWDGIELFDRIHGRVVRLNAKSKQILSEQIIHNKTPKELNISELPQELVDLEILVDEKWNIESLINTPYPKTLAFASAPRRIYWEFTRKCNLNCKACFNRFFLNQDELSIKTVLNIAQQLFDSGVYEIRCTGGEPTVRADFFEIVTELKKIGFYLSMGTNGIYSKKTLKKVLDAPIDWIIVSLDGANEFVNANIRGNDNFGQAKKTLESLSSKGCRIRINTLIRKGNYNYNHLKGLAELCDHFNFESLNCIPLRPLTNDSEVLNLQLTPSEFKEFIDGLNRLRQKFKTEFVTTLDLRHTSVHDRIYFKDRSCAAGREGTVISPYGEIYGCSYSKASIPDAPKAQRDLYVAGNLLENDFLEIWNDSAKWAIYRDLDKYKHEKCKKCNYYISRQCIGNCPIMDEKNPAAFDPYCYLYLEDNS